MWVQVIHFGIVYAIPFFMSLNRVGEVPSNQRRIKGMLIYWMINVLLITIQQALKIDTQYYFIAKVLLAYWLYSARTQGGWWIFKKTNGLLGKGFAYDLGEEEKAKSR